MRTVKVEYRVRPDYVETNKQNIVNVMKELRGLGDVGVQYSSHVKEDGQSFVHIVMQRDEAAAKVLGGLESFKTFQAQLKGGLEVPPKAEELKLVEKSFDL